MGGENGDMHILKNHTIFGRIDRLTKFAALLLLTLLLLGAFGRYLMLGDPTAIGVGPRLAPPTWSLPLGTDQLGRSYLPRLVQGIRATFLVASIAVLLTAVLGTVIGMTSAYVGGWVDVLIMRLADVLFAFPALILGLLMAAIHPSGNFGVVTVISTATLPLFVRVVRSVSLSLSDRGFIIAAEIAGASRTRVMFVHLLPNIAGAVLIQLTYALSVGMVIESALSFLGLGVQPPLASLGSLLRTGALYLTIAPWMVFSAGIVLSIAIMSINLLGDGLRDLLDPLQMRSLR
jgi:peptide/nickel transport system permease protein